MRTKSFDLFEMYVIALREGIDHPIQLDVSKTGGRLSLAAMTAKDLVLEANGGVYLATNDLTLTSGSRYATASEIFELVALQETHQDIAVWYVQPARAEKLPEAAKPWPSTSPA
jgi:hypothetical protein